MIEDIRRLLFDWGDWMRSEKATPRGIGYPEQSVGAEMMDTPRTRTAEREAEVHRIAHIARQTAVYRTNDAGDRERVMDMIPRSQPKDSRGRNNRAPDYEPAPREILLCHDAVLTLPLSERNAIIRKYVDRTPIRDAAYAEDTSESTYRNRIMRAEGHIRGRLSGSWAC